MSAVSNSDYAYSWLERAHTNATAAQALAAIDHKLDALFHMQQAMELATKGLRLANGASYGEVTAHSHDTLDSLLTLFTEPAQAGNFLNAFLDLFKPELLEKLVVAHQSSISGNRRGAKKAMKRVFSEYRRMIQFISAKEVDKSEAAIFRASVATYPPEVVEMFIDLLQKIRGKILEVTKEPVMIPALPPGEDWFQWLCSQIVRQVSKRIPNMKSRMLTRAEVRLVKAVLGPIDESGLSKAMGKRSEWRVSRQFEEVMAHLSLYIVGTISWPHAVSARYPGPPAHRTTAFDAAKLSKMGTQHYGDQIGAFASVETLAYEAEWATRVLKRGLRGRSKHHQGTYTG